MVTQWFWGYMFHILTGINKTTSHNICFKQKHDTMQDITPHQRGKERSKPPDRAEKMRL